MCLLPLFWLSFIFTTSTVYHHLEAAIFALTASFCAQLFTKLLHPLLLTVWVFIRQPVVLVAVDIIARVPSVALLLSRVTIDILTLVGIAHLELISRPHAGTASVGWSERG